MKEIEQPAEKRYAMNIQIRNRVDNLSAPKASRDLCPESFLENCRIVCGTGRLPRTFSFTCDATRADARGMRRRATRLPPFLVSLANLFLSPCW